MTNTLHISAGGDIGGIETLFRSVADSINNSSLTFCFFSDGITSKYIKEHTKCRTIVFNNHRFDKQQLKSLEKYILDNNIGRVVLHSDTYYMFLYFLKLMKKFPELDYFFIGHNCKEKEKFRPSRKWLGYFLINLYTKKVVKKINRLICVSEAGERSYIDILGVNPKKISVVYNGIPDNFGEKVSKKNFKDKIIFLYAGRYEKVKGVLNLVDSFKRIDSDKAELQLVGDGSLKETLTELTKDSPNIKCLPKTDKIKDFYKIADYFVYPSVWEEVFGISIIEAMSFGVVPIVNRVGGIPEIVTKNEGFLVDPKTSGDLDRALKEAIEIYGSEKYEEFRDNSLLKCKYFSISNMIEGYENVFEKYKKEH